MNPNRFLTAFVLFILFTNTALPAFSQAKNESFNKVELLVPNGEKISEKNVRLNFLEDELQIVSITNGTTLKTFKYADVKDAEYSYTKNPRWKTGLGLGAAGLFFPPLLLVAIPLGFTKHRRHWLTIQTADDYAVLKLSKNNRKLILPAFESKTGVKVSGQGENK